MLGTLDFTGSQRWATFNFPSSTALCSILHIYMLLTAFEPKKSGLPLRVGLVTSMTTGYCHRKQKEHKETNFLAAQFPRWNPGDSPTIKYFSKKFQYSAFQSYK